MKLNTNKKQFWETLPKNLKILLLFGQTYDNKKDDELIISEDKIVEVLSRSELNLSNYTEYFFDYNGDLESCKNIYNLKLENLLPLSNFHNIRKLNINGQPINSFSGLEDKFGLVQLFATETKIVDLKAIKNLNRLKFLNLRCSKVESIKDLPEGEIEQIDLTACFNVIDFTPLSKLRNLKNVSVFNTKFKNLNCLTCIDSLETIDIGACDITKLPTSGQLQNLKTLYISKGQVSDDEIKAFTKVFPKCEISFDVARDLFGKRTASEEQKLRDDIDFHMYLYEDNF